MNGGMFPTGHSLFAKERTLIKNIHTYLWGAQWELGGVAMYRKRCCCFPSFFSRCRLCSSREYSPFYQTSFLSFVFKDQLSRFSQCSVFKRLTGIIPPEKLPSLQNKFGTLHVMATFNGFFLLKLENLLLDVRKNSIYFHQEIAS